MTLIYVDACDSYGTTTGTGTAARPAPTNYIGRKAVQTQNGEFRVQSSDIGRSLHSGTLLNFQPLFRVFELPAASKSATFIGGCLLQYNEDRLCTRTYSRDQALIVFNEGTSDGMRLVNDGGTLSVYRGTTVLKTWVGGCFRFEQSFYIEFKAYCHSSSGSYSVRVNDVEVMADSGIQTKVTAGAGEGQYDRFRIGISYCFYMDHIYIANGEGSTNNDFLGPIKVETIRPSDDRVNSFSTGNYLDIDEEQCDDGTTYMDGVSSNSIECEYGNLSVNFTSILGVQVTADYSVDANETIQLTANSTALESTDSIDRASTNINSYTIAQRVFETDSTGNAWTPGTINSAAFGLEIQ